MATLTVEKEECVLRGYVPLEKIQEILKTGQKLEKIEFPGNGYCTDAVLHQLKHAHTDILSEVKEIDLKGCFLLTDHGLLSLLGLLENTKHLSKFDLSGCELLTDNTFALLHDLNKDGHTWSMKCTGVNYMHNTNIGIETRGCPSFGGGGEIHKHGQVLIVPHPSLKNSFAAYLLSGAIRERKSGMHKPDWQLEAWKMAITEVPSHSCLFDTLINTQLTQVIIPFDASSDPKDIKDHVMSTISRVVAKEPIQEELPRVKSFAMEDGTMSERPFMDVHMLDKLHLNEDLIIRNVSISDRLIGVYVSHTPLTRSNPYFEVECVESGTGKVGLLIGSLYDLLFSERHPMDSTAETGGVVDGFEAVKPGDKIGFGVEGEWLSEYVPGTDCKYYFVENGEKKLGKDQSASDVPRIGIYPLLSLLGEDFGAVRLPSLVNPPQEVIDVWRRENRWIEQGYTCNVLVDNKGIVSYVDNYGSALSPGLFVSGQPISQLNHSFSVTIETLDTDIEGKPVCIGVVPETFSMAKKVSSYIYWCLGKEIVWGENTDSRKAVENKVDVGDTVTVTISKITGYTGVVTETMKLDVKFLLNGKVVFEKEEWLYELKHAGLRLVPMVSLASNSSKLKLNNYRPKYRRPAPYHNKITMGRCHYANIMDTGDLEFKEFKKGTTERALFVAKTPFNKEQLEFEVEVRELSAKKLFAIGACHYGYPVNQFLGWKQGSVGYHADNGRVYMNSSSGATSYMKVSDDEAIINSGDVVGLRVEPVNDNMPLHFDKRGNVDSQQMVKLVFLKNSVVIHEVEHEILGDGIYPAVSLQTAGDQFKLKNFYPETNQLWDLTEKQKEEKLMKKKESGLSTKEVERFKGTEFLLVGVSSGSSDPSGKLQILQQQINLKDGWTERQKVQKAITEYEKNLKSLDLQEQRTYSQLCAILENMKSLAENPDRIKFKSLELESGKGIEGIKTEIEQTQISHRALQPQRYVMTSLVTKVEEEILNSLQKNKIVEFTSLVEKLSGKATMTLLKEMHSQGKLLLLSIGNDTFIADIQFMFDMEERLMALMPTTMLEIDTMVTSIGQSSHVWTAQALEKKVLVDIPSSEKERVGLLLTKVLGLIRLPCLRTSPEQQQCVYAIQQNVSNPLAPMVEYWNNKQDSTDFAVMSQKYWFPTSFPEHILSLIISNTVQYGQVIILTGDGIVYQNGAVQTVIIQHQSVDDGESVTVQSKCYMPDLESHEDAKLSKETISYVNEYTWNIFCIYTDIIDDLLQRENITVAVKKEVPTGLVNVSVGCKHSWIHKGDNVTQTVCTMCNSCCEKGNNCEWNGIVGEYLRQCGCKTSLVGCKSCGICGRCADELWGIRSRLRPFASSTTEVKQTITEKTDKKNGPDEDKEKEGRTMILRDPVQQPIIPLDPFLYNEMEFINLSAQHKIICLKEESDGTTLQAFPGKACYIQDLEKVALNRTYDSQYRLNIGDHIKIKLNDPLGASYISQEEVETKETLKIEPQYFALAGREAKIVHETGIILYDTNSSSIPVAQFIACKPLTKEHNNFSIRILKTGKSGTIAVGLVPKNYPPNRQPGWNVQSIGYHADDGGIYLESGWPTRKTKVAKVGDIMSFYVDMDRNKGFFRKNGEQCIELNLNPSKLGYYPCVAMHSVGEAVQIIEKSFWEPQGTPDSSLEPPAFPTHKYGNLWISPGQKVTMTKLQSNFSGWLILHNPSKDPVGFKVVYGRKPEQKAYGVLEYKRDWLEHLEMAKADLRDAILVEWTSLESGRKYNDDDIKLLFGEDEDVIHQSSHQHRLTVVVQESSSIVEELPSCTSEPSEKTMLCLQVYKNLSLVDEYWLKYGNYHVTVETKSKDADFLLKYPKCPSFQYAKTFQKGMKLTMRLESSNTYAECIIVEVYSGGKMLALEYSPKDTNVNATVCVMANSSALKYSDFNGESDTVLVYQSRNTPVTLTRTFVWTPPYLLSEGSKKCMMFMDKEWKANTLRAVSQCFQMFTRLTVQEQSINNASNNMVDWVKFESNYRLCYLPNQLSVHNLAYPQVNTMFSDVAVHRMCFSSNEFMSPVIEQFKIKNEKWRIPLHFIDIPGVKPSSSLPLEMLWANNPTTWCYTALISSKLYLPLYEAMISGDKTLFSRQQIEHLLYRMLQIYTSLCGIYNARLGGIEFSENNDDPRIVTQLMKQDNTHIVRFSGKPVTETNILVKTSGIAVCKAHLMNVGVSESLYPGSLTFTYKHFEPYFEHVTMFSWMHSKVTEFPSDFFEKFQQLQVFQLIGMGSFESLPLGISKLKNLQVVEVSNTAMKELPDDFFMSPSAVSVTCTDMPVRKLPTKFLPESKISKLIIAGLLLKAVPKELSLLGELEHLELCYNSITDLPKEMEELKKLKIFHLLGCPWITLKGNKTQMTYEQYFNWVFALNPFIKNTLGEEKVEKLFGEFDYNHNGSLDEEELAGLNCQLFFDIPRLGLDDLNDEVTGGIPPVIFSMRSLNELYLDYQAITMVPQSINNLQNLNTLSLSHNPLLESLPGSLGHLPNIKAINLQSCPVLRTPPNEVVSRGFESVKAYLKRLAGGFTECRRTKLMVVGLGGAGKTSLLRALMSEKKQTTGTEKEIPTDGIDIVPWTVASEDGTEVTYSTWDFAGQAVYYNTHQFFLSKRAVYLLLWSMRQGYEHAGLDFWLSSISCHAPNTPILVIGTQCDLIPKAEIPEKELLERYPQIASFHQVSSVKGIGIKELEKSLLDVTLQQGYMGEKIPQVWLNFEKRILAERQTKKNYLKWDVARGYAMEAGIYDEKDVRLAVQLLHDLGTLQYFDNDFLRDYVVINPQWIVNVMACVVSAQDSSIQKNKGRFLHADIPEIWKDYSEELRPWLLRLTEDFDLTFPLPKEPVNVVPCLLPGEEPEDLKWPSVRNQAGIRETKMVYRFHYLPSGLFNRAQVRLFQFSDGKQVWKKGSLLSKNNHLALIKQSDSKELVVLVQGPRPENILFLIHEVFESIIEESFNGVSYEMFVPCPDCILKEGTYDPCLFNSHLIERANALKAPFIQCTKFFHMISMAQLQEKMPAESREVADFDVQLQQSLVALQELNNELTMDAAIIYCKDDVPKPGDKVTIPPALIRDDLQDWGYHCWFPEDMENVNEIDLITAIKNCKIVIAVVSDQFERDAKCRDMLIYAKETLNKEIIVVVSGENLEWQNKDMGMKIGAQERKLMAKTLARYTVERGRRSELRDWMEEKLQQQRSSESQLPDVFISYCWSNSQSAAEKSGKFLAEAIGWADPRQIKAVLQESGIKCWIDIENVGKEKKGIFADMAAGIRNSKLMLACISDEYAESDNCMMELRFGILNMDLPVVVAVVGTGSIWKETEVAMLLRRAKAPEVYLQKENEAGFNSLVKFVKEKLLSIELSGGSKRKKNMKKVQKKGTDSESKEKQSNIAYQEEYELLQRKFMRHIFHINAVTQTLEPLPRLVVADFVKSVKAKPETDGRSSSTLMPRKTIRPKTATRSRDRLQVDVEALEQEDYTDWQSESFCLRVLCEHEEGWHLCDEMFPLAFRTRDLLETFFRKAAPYLYRMYSILKQSPVKLKCFASGKGEAFQNWIIAESEENADFIGSMGHLQSGLVTDDASEVLKCIARCRLPSGRIVWLCNKHQGGEHVSKLSTSSTGGGHNLIKVLFNEDKLLRENIEKYDKYKELKAIKSDKIAPRLPPPVPVPIYEPKVTPTREHEKREDKETKKEEEKKEEAKKEESTTKKSEQPDVTPTLRPESTKTEEPPLLPSKPTAPQNQPTPSLVQKSAPLSPKDKGEQGKQSTSEVQTTDNRGNNKTENNEDMNKAENQVKIEENQLGKDNILEAHKNLVESGNEANSEKDTKNKAIMKNMKRLDSKLLVTPEIPEQERKEEKEMSADNSITTDKTDSMGINDQKRKDSIKQSVIDELRKTQKGKKTVGPITRKKLSNVSKTEDRRSTFEHRNSKGVLLKGSNVARVNLSSGSSSDSIKSQPKARTSTNPRWTWNDPELVKSLTVQKVNKSHEEIFPEPTKAPPNSSIPKNKLNSGERKTRPDEGKSSLEKVRPKKIVVKPKESTGVKTAQSPQRRASVTVTGIALGPGSPDRPLPERTPSKACVIQ